MFTPEVHGGRRCGGRAAPDGIVGGSHVGNNAGRMRVGVDELVWGGNHFLLWHG